MKILVGRYSLALMLSGAMAAAAPPGIAAERQLPPVVGPSAPTQAAPVPGAVSPPAPVIPIEARVAKLERMMESQALLDLVARVERLQQEVQTLRGELEVQAHNIEGITQRQRDLYGDIDRRLRQMELSAATPSPGGAPSAPLPGGGSGMSGAMPGTAAPGAVSAPSADPAAERATYEQAFNRLKDGRYDEAITAFQAFLASYPNGGYADNAQYWLGEAHYVTRKFDRAVESFNKVLTAYPQSAKGPDAMLKLGYSYYELSDWKNARKTLENLVTKHPQTTAAMLADKRLEKMRAEGH